MARDFAKAFYASELWKATRDEYIRQVDGLCEKCLENGFYKPGKIVHHRIHLTPKNITDKEITLSFRNLQLLCQDCHAEVHASKKQGRCKFDKEGNLIFLEEDPPGEG